MHSAFFDGSGGGEELAPCCQSQLDLCDNILKKKLLASLHSSIINFIKKSFVRIDKM